ncbi:GNAT family N-acetyltransferase [Spirosoma pollinicola]|uniref:GNAT family N-acetyltransferase n=1 Tax=Spirosoma pollinicola TaxID=2057025 RepID=A0A2K8YX44_9BACT|nr:GNAT family N-acetyltransferase [Spirosoma pollinicola]AUD02196.1 GNAT family N-acetyltransferase [Spirosoma pollinicola]
MTHYREATANDAEPIAQLHSLSWQQNYRGIWRDEFLNGHVLENRRDVWRKRLQQPDTNQYVLVAESAGVICGFACTYADKDPVWGTLLDNLHVLKNQNGQGIGTQLIKLAANWAYSKSTASGFYLWVLPENRNARIFYEKLGAVNHELMSLESPDGGYSGAYRYVWQDIKTLI